MANFAIWTSRGWLHDWNGRKGEPTYTNSLDNAAIWDNLHNVAWLRSRVNGVVVDTETRHALTLTELHTNA